MLRGTAVTGDAGPTQLLPQLDAAITQLELSAYATAAIAPIEQTCEELAQGTARMRWAGAGHSPPSSSDRTTGSSSWPAGDEKSSSRGLLQLRLTAVGTDHAATAA
jgi:hypothetical protein